MRIAVVGVGDIGRRTTLMLLGSPEVALLTTVGFGLSAADDRLQHAADIDVFEGPVDAIVTDVESRIDDDVAARSAVLGARHVSSRQWGLRAIAENLAAHERKLAADAESVVAAYSVTGRPHTSGVAIPFPDPVGSRWGRRLGAGATAEVCEAATPGPWGAVTALVTSRDGSTRAVGASDLATRLGAFAVAAAVLAPQQNPTAYVETLLGLGLEVAATTVPGSERVASRPR